MSTKTLFFTSIALVFVAGWAFGFSLGDMRGASTALPKSEQEQTLYSSLQTARRTSTSAGDNFRVAVTTMAHDYVFTLSESGRSVARGGETKAVIPATDARTAALVSPFGPVISKASQVEHLQLWTSMTNAFYRYADAKASNNAADLNVASETITALSAELAQFYSTLGVQDPVTTLQIGLARAMGELEKSIDATNGGTLLTSLESGQRAAQELGNIMSQVTTGIIQVNPNKF